MEALCGHGTPSRRSVHSSPRIAFGWDAGFPNDAGGEVGQLLTLKAGNKSRRDQFRLCDREAHRSNAGDHLMQTEAVLASVAMPKNPILAMPVEQLLAIRADEFIGKLR